MDNVMHIIKVAVPILFALIVLILLWTLFKAARKKIKDTQLTMAAMVAAKRTEAPEEKGAGRQYFITFQVANGTHMEFAVTRNVYAHLAVDDVGQLRSSAPTLSTSKRPAKQSRLSRRQKRRKNNAKKSPPPGGDFFAFSKVSQSSRRRSGANKMKFVFCGGVYVAKNTLRGKRVFCLLTAGKTRGSERDPIFLPKAIGLWQKITSKACQTAGI